MTSLTEPKPILPRVLNAVQSASREQHGSSLLSTCRNGAIMVSTDAAARGLDLPDVEHVIQADFAASAVDFLHRVSQK